MRRSRACLIPSARKFTREQESYLCSVIERDREAQLLQEAENDARRRRIARCQAEIAALEAQPMNIPDRAYLVTMGIEDWRAEQRMIESEAR